MVRLWLGDGALHAEQAAMPGMRHPTAPMFRSPSTPMRRTSRSSHPSLASPSATSPKNFQRYLAEGVPIMPIDDQGRGNSYPLMRVQAHDATATSSPRSTPCCRWPPKPIARAAIWSRKSAAGSASAFPATTSPTSTTAAPSSSPPRHHQYRRNEVPGDTAEQIALNAAKINILRLHDARHRPTLDSERFITCASCHYSPALDLAQLGPNDDNGKQQTQHVSMSRAMHGFHGGLRDDRDNDPQGVFANLFPDMPPPAERTPESSLALGETCYNCHPGKRTKCLRGAMETGGMVCQDCHGQSTQVGNDFTANFPAQPGQAVADLRVPWANEPCASPVMSATCCRCRSVVRCRRSWLDAAVNASDKSGNADGLRLEHGLCPWRARGQWRRRPAHRCSTSPTRASHPTCRCTACPAATTAATRAMAGSAAKAATAPPMPSGPTPTPGPTTTRRPTDLQGHTGTIIECSTCHEGDLGNTLDGPHGMHAVGGTRFADGGHEDIAESDKDACRACHGRNGEGTVLSRAATNRTFTIEECKQGTLCPNGEYENFTVHLTRGEPVSCLMCHENKL